MDAPLLHAFTLLRSLGGVQSVLQQHLAQDPRWGLRSQVLAYFEPDTPGDTRVRGLGLTWRTCIRQARARFARLRPELPRELFVAYYNFWGLPFFAGVDRAARRVGILHSDWPDLPACLRQVERLVDGVLCVSQPLLEQARGVWPDLGDRLAFLPCPINVSTPQTSKAPLAGRPIVLGYCGRISKEQKRVDRFPELARALTAAGLDFRLELLGDGPQAAWLRSQFAGSSRVTFHGRLEGEAYWQVLRGWDAILFLSDYEGLPLGLLEAMGAGAIPIYPRIGCGGGAYVEQVNPDFWYPAGDLAALVVAVRRLRDAPEAQVQVWRERGAQAIEPHLGDRYFRTFTDFVTRIHERPRISPSRLPPRPCYWSDWVPFGLLRRLCFRGFWRGDER